MSYDPSDRRPREPVRRGEDPRTPAAPDSTAGYGGASEAHVYALEQRLRSLRTGLVALGVVAVLALVVAGLAIASGGDDDTGGARTPAALRKDVAKLEERVADRATKGDLDDLRDDLEKTATTPSSASSDGDSDVSGDVDALQDEVSKLGDRVDELEQSASSGGAATDGTTDGTATTP